MLKICDINHFVERVLLSEGVVCFGAGKWSERMKEIFKGTQVLDKVIYFVDNNKEKEGKFIDLEKKKISIISVNQLEKLVNMNIIILITCVSYAQILTQINDSEKLKDIECYCLQHLIALRNEERAMKKEIPNKLRISNVPLIPKIIHYCWFGKKTIPDKYKRWMDSWKRFCPDYEIKEWNESNYDISKNHYMRQAYECEKWGFVPDYARLDIIFNNGGIYLDTDVEIIAGLDELLYQDGFAGFETEELVALGLGFGAVPGLAIIKEMMEFYENQNFINEDKSLNMTASPRLQTEVLLKHGLKQNGEYQIVDGLTIYPEKMFCGKNVSTRRIKLKSYTKSIHHYDASWVDENKRREYIQLEQEMNSTK